MWSSDPQYDVKMDYSVFAPKIQTVQNPKVMQKIRQLKSSAVSLQTVTDDTEDIWVENLYTLEETLKKMRKELFEARASQNVSVTGQIVLEHAAKQAMKLTEETMEAHKALHINISRIGKTIDKHFDEATELEYENDCEMTFPLRENYIAADMMYEYFMCNGKNYIGEMMKENYNIAKNYEVLQPHLLQQIFLDFRQFAGINGCIEHVEKVHPPDEKELKRALLTQMVIDSIRKGSDDCGTIQRLAHRLEPFMDDLNKASHLIGALVVGKHSATDSRYRGIFDSSLRVKNLERMSLFFVPYIPQLKDLLEIGFHNMSKITDMWLLGHSVDMSGGELPSGTLSDVNHSAFVCPILKEQCTNENPPMRLVCGHVVSRDAISRLTTNQRANRTAPRHSRHLRFKCPYCPREQYMDATKPLVFDDWLHGEFAEHDIDSLQFLD